MAQLGPIVGLCSLVLLLSMLYLRRNRRGVRLPPGPRKLPVIGNMLDMPAECQWQVYARWAREFGSDIIHLDIPLTRTSIIILSSLESAQDLLEKRSTTYSDRPIFPMLHGLVAGEDRFFGFGKYNDTWRRQRRLFHQAVAGAAGRRFHPRALKHAHALLRRLLEDPAAYADHIDYIIDANVISVAYGVEVTSPADPCVTAPSSGMDAVRAALIPGRFLVDTLPILRYLPAWIPGAGFKRQAAGWKRQVEAMVDVPYEAAKHLVYLSEENGEAPPPSFVTDNLRELLREHGGGVTHAQEVDLKDVASTMFGAGSDTTRFTLRSFIRGMLENPEAQKRAQAEIDAVLGPGRLPDFADEARLPWVSACVKETLRWWPVTPLGLPRVVRGEDIYRGYRIPDGSIVFANIWAILHDETAYPDPEAFKPERFLDEDGKLNPAVMDPQAAFGFGRRICAGKDMAWNTLWIIIASVLAAFDISKAVDEDGEVIEPPPGHPSALVDFPLPFRCCIKPRSRAVEELVRATGNL